jgi:DUF4097 and DUF4098 domain-containing protein YvlB
MRKLALAALILSIAATAEAATLTETIDKTFDVRPGATVSLTNVNGRITISSWDQPRVQVVARKEVKGDRDDARDALKDLRVEMQAREGGLVITTHSPKDHGGSSFFDWILGDHVDYQVRYDLTVPRNMNLEVSNTNGRILVTNVAGEHELDTTNGRIEVDGCSGTLDASTTNGTISAELVRVTKGKPLRFETTNGGIELTLPAGLAADVDAGTTNGSIHSDLPVSTTSAKSNRLRGTVNGGGTPVRLRTTNGGIKIRTAGATGS